MRYLSSVLALLGILLFGSLARAQTDPDAIRASKRIRPLRITEPIVIDGHLTEPAWALAEAGGDFYQQEPNEGALTSERSDIRFLYDDDALYFAGTFADSDPRGPIIDDLKRDFEGRNGDIVGVSFDTFGDYSAYNFNVNAAGVLRDTQSYEDGRVFNANWDALWSATTQRTEGGWTLEMRIPFKSMRFPKAEEHDWAMNVFRLIRRKNEFTYWSPQPRQFNAYKISYGGRISGIRGVRSGRNLQIKPFYTGAASNLRLPSLDRRWDGDGGVDVKYGIGTSLALDLTLHTDFSQVEVDEQQINLTRFSLLFPEKREFFLENQGAFRIGDLSGRTLIPFFSRRVGLSDNGQPIPIIGGARLTGRQGDYTLGLLNIQTERFDGRPADNFSTFRAARNFGGSSIGGFYLGREASGPGFNRVAGADIHLNMRQTMELFAFAMRSDTAGAPGGSAGRASFTITQRAYSADVSYTNISPEFRNDLGFISRGDIGLVAWDVARHFRSTRQGALLRVLSFGTLGERFDDSSHTALNSRRVRAYSRLNFSDGGTLNANADANYERLLQPFQVSRNVAIAPGEYRFTQAIGGYTSNASNPLSFSADVTAGEFYSGTIRGITGSVRWRVNTNLSASTSFESNDVDLTEGEFDTQVARFRLDFAFNPRMFLNSFMQYNNATSSWLTNVRYRFTYRPLSDFYLVYNDVRTAGRPDQRTFAIKHTLMLAF